MKKYKKPVLTFNRTECDIILASINPGDSFYENETPLVPIE